MPWVLIGIAAVVGAIVAGASLVVIICLVALAGAAIALGWRFGENAKSALEEEIEHRTSELKRALSELEIAQAETVQRLSMAVEFRDEDTGAHIERIGRFSVLLAEHIGMDSDFCERLRHAAPLHDVGKVAIPDAILLKPGPLTPEERAIVETHAEEGHRLVRGSSSSILDMAATIALSHQEKWDGTGYPRGLKGEAIPIEGRIVAVADVFDALTSDRVYRKAFSVEDAVQMMREQRGRHFDPVLLDAFMEVLGRTGPDAREQLRSDPAALVESSLETFATALERGDAEMAEGAIATARSSARHCGGSTCSPKRGRSTPSASTVRARSPGACWQRSTAT
jgi:HD-GYP domain-containing protein (c-di-GMP phosphodiesterase class II)